jgi:hypothetical protein
MVDIQYKRKIRTESEAGKAQAAEKESVQGVRIYCIGLVSLHHLFYKGAAGPLGLQGWRTPGAASPVCRLPCSRHPRAASPGAGPLGLQGRQPIRVSGGAASPRCRLH